MHVFVMHNGQLTPRMELRHTGPITDVAYSPDGQYLVAADANRRVILYRLPGYEVRTKSTRPVDIGGRRLSRSFTKKFSSYHDVWLHCYLTWRPHLTGIQIGRGPSPMSSSLLSLFS